MPAEKGNKYYLLRTTHGRPRKFETPEQLGKVCNKYFQWAVENPYKKPVIVHKPWTEVIEEEYIDKKGEKQTKTIKKTHPYTTVYEEVPRPFSLEALCNHIDIDVTTFRDYERKEDFSLICTRIRQIIDNQQIEGASLNIYNANIIARRQGLIEKSDITSKGDKLPPPVQQEIKISKEEIKEIAKELLNDI